jgi:acyl carrier protein
VNIQQEVLKVLDEVLDLRGRSAAMTRDSALLGALPELDSIAVVGIITTLEERFELTIHDDEVDASNFDTVGTLTDFVAAKLQAVG